jgi:hypothetical protein
MTGERIRREGGGVMWECKTQHMTHVRESCLDQVDAAMVRLPSNVLGFYGI